MRYIRMGEVLMDENRQLILLCENCHSEFTQVQALRVHLETCTGLEYLFQPHTVLAYDERSHIQKVGASNDGLLKQFNVYNYKNVSKLELHSKGTDFVIQTPMQLNAKVAQTSNKPNERQSYKNLVKEITPYMQIKETKPNVMALKNSISTMTVAKNNPQIAKPTVLNNLKATIQAALPVTTMQSENKILIKNPMTNRNAKQTKMYITELPNGNMQKINTLPVVINQTILSPSKVKQEQQPQQQHQQQIFRLTGNAANLIQTSISSLEPPSAKKPKLETTPCSFSDTQTTPKRLLSARTSTPKRKAPSQQLIVINGNLAKAKPVANNNQVRNTANNMVAQSVPTNLSPTLLRAKLLAQQNAANAKKQETERILNHLQNLGLEVKRKQENPNQTVQLLKKLQSKGMNIKVVSRVKPSEENGT